MSEVKRWAHHVTWDGELKIQATMMALRSNGEYVLASDYDALAAECELLRGTLAAAQRVTLAVCDERDAALAELAALKGGREAVAWRYRHSEQERWHVGDAPKSWWECQPLYAAPPAQASAWVPEGWKLVPVEMTREMIDAANSARGWVESDSLSRGCYKAMLAAAPTPGSSDGK